MNEWISREALLTEGYRRCAKLTWQYGTTYFWGAALLPRPQRKHVYAIYALCRLADDIVDLPNGQGSGTSTSSGHNSAISTSSAHHSSTSTRSAQNSVRERLTAFAESFQTGLA
jgi:phytoene/squalene synthetase